MNLDELPEALEVLGELLDRGADRVRGRGASVSAVFARLRRLSRHLLAPDDVIVLLPWIPS